MTSEYKIHRPCVLAALPRPLDHTDGRIFAREVYGQRDGQKKRKRTELVVGVDGETTSIYDIPASRLVTSYPIPPQESFTFAPYSIRVRREGSSEICRYTYIATHEAAAQKITLFKDVVHRDGKTTSTSASQTLRASPVQFLTCSSASSQLSHVGDVVVVCRDGEVFCLAGETLALQWSSSAKSAVQDVVSTAIDEFEVENVTAGSVTDFNEGLFRDRPEVFSTLPRALDSNPELLAIIAKTSSQGKENHYLIVAAATSGSSSAQSDSQRLLLLDVVPLPPATDRGDGKTAFQVDVQSGLLLQLCQGALSVYDVTAALPKLTSVMQMDSADSFTRLSKPFVLASSLDSIGLYNHQYRSIHAKASLDLSELPAESQEPRSCELISYYRNQELVVALIDTLLVVIQVESPKVSGKRRKGGLLIDSIGRGTAMEIPPEKRRRGEPTPEFSRRASNTMTESYLATFYADVAAADELLSSNDLVRWEHLLLNKFHMSLEKAPLPNGNGVGDSDMADSKDLPEWNWHTAPFTYSAVDRRWIIYALSRVLLVEASEAEERRTRLRLILPESNVVTYLVVAGHMTLSNIKSAFRDDLGNDATINKQLAEDLVECLTETDGSMTLLLNYLEVTKLGELELLLGVRALMRSLDLISDSPRANTMKLLGHAPLEEVDPTQDMDLDDLERELAITEHYLREDSSGRSHGLTMALTRLWRLPATSTVRALRASWTTEDIVSLICLLRVELVRGAWTSLYIDPTSFDSEGQESPADSVIMLIADMLGRCLDAVGAGGWLVNDAMSPADRSENGDFLTALKLEATAALEGIEEAVYLGGIVGEAVRFGYTSRGKGSGGGGGASASRPLTVQVEGRESRLLPLGLKTKQPPTRDKVVSGGEVVQRSVRETGHLISRKVEPYSLEKLAI